VGDPVHGDQLPPITLAKGAARSLSTARVGQLLYVNEQGNVTRPTIALFRRILPWLLPVLVAPWIFPEALPLLVAVTTLFFPVSFVYLVFMWARPQRGIRRALARLSAGDLVGAEQAALLVANGSLIARLLRGNAWNIAGSVRFLRGDHREALVLTRRALSELPSRGGARVFSVIARLNEIQLLALTGEQASAHEALTALEREGLPEGDLVRLQWIDTQLVLAFEADDTSTLPDDLDAWSRAVLDTNRFGSTLVLLAWALQQRGQPELVPVLLDVARDRLPECHIETAHPRLAAWYRDAKSASGTPSVLAIGNGDG
jgi:hypothetical protein